MIDKPKQFSQEYANIFQDASVVAAYEYRPMYPEETFHVLNDLIPASAAPRTVLDAGCGTGFVARPFAAYVDHIDAVDIAARMVAAAQTLPGGDRPNITWITAPIESAPLGGPYALITAGASFHWMDWERTLPRFAAHLLPNCVLALVEPAEGAPNPWDAQLGPIYGRYSMNVDYRPYSLAGIAADLAQRGLFHTQGSHVTAPVVVRQPIAEWVESVHARNGFSRDRMDLQMAAACDEELRAVVQPYCPDGIVEFQVAAQIVWGVPLDPIKP